MIITYPAGAGNSISGDVSMYKPSDAKSDFKVKVEPGTDMKQIIPKEKLSTGLWKVQVMWASDGKEYFSEEKVMIQ